MITDEIRAAIQKRAATDDEWAYGVDQCCKEEIEILARHLEDTISSSPKEKKLIERVRRVWAYHTGSN